MLRLNFGRLGWVMLLALCFWSVAAHAERYRYRYVSLNQFIPSGYRFIEPSSIDDKGRVYGTIYDDSFEGHIFVYADDVMSILQPGYAYEPGRANERGMVGGFTLDPVDFRMQATLFGRDRVTLIPFQAGETSSEVVALDDHGTALVRSYDDSGSVAYSLYRKGRSLPLDFGPDIAPQSVSTDFVYMNNKGVVAGTMFDPARGSRAFRVDSSTGEAALFEPRPSDLDTWGMGVDKRGDVLGYSFVFDGRERIGVWDREGVFESRFVEGIPEFPTISNRLLFNDKGLIVITNVSSPADERGNSYLVPKPGVRLDLADLVENLPWSFQLAGIIDVNERGSMIGRGTNFFDTYLLERIRGNRR